MNFEAWLSAKHPEIPLRGATAVLRLTEEGATLPFIARYRKEQTGNLDEVAIQNVLTSKERWDAVVHRQAFILGEIEAQGKLTPELRGQISTTFDLAILEDLYLPYKQKKKSKAQWAREAGVGPLADWIWNCGHGLETAQPGQTLEIWAFTFRNEEKGLTEVEKVIQAAQDILVERLSEDFALRSKVREAAMEQGCIRTEKAEKAKTPSKFEKYFDYREPVKSLLDPQNSHRYLALRRGFAEEELKLSLAGPMNDESWEARLQGAFEVAALTVPESPGAAVLKKAALLAYKVHVLPSVEREVHKRLKEVADQTAMRVFAENLRRVLLAAPYGPRAVLGVDPGVRTGCKMAVVNASGAFVAHGLFYLHSEELVGVAKGIVKEVLSSHPVDAIAVGNGTHGRETESFLRLVTKEMGREIPVVMVSESGASVYSASDVAREEFPEIDLTIRGAISIARRLQDPLAELVKVEPKAIGVGQYQHDVAPQLLKEGLEGVVESCVNSVGVNVNTASPSLLAYVAGIGPALSKSIVAKRNDIGLFKSKLQLLEVSSFSAKTFEQSAGFLRVPDSDNPLDKTGVHPERYAALDSYLKKAGRDVASVVGEGARALLQDAEFKTLFGEFTAADIAAELAKPGRDPRSLFQPVRFRDDIFKLEDLKPGLICPGIVTNVTNFGAFVDIGVHQDGLVHISQLCDRFVKDPREVVNPGDAVNVRVLEANLEKRQISLSMKSERPANAQAPRQGEGRGHAPRDRQPQARVAAAQQKGGGGRPNRGPARPPKPKFGHNPFASLAGLKVNPQNNDKK